MIIYSIRVRPRTIESEIVENLMDCVSSLPGLAGNLVISVDAITKEGTGGRVLERRPLVAAQGPTRGGQCP